MLLAAENVARFEDQSGARTFVRLDVLGILRSGAKVANESEEACEFSLGKCCARVAVQLSRRVERQVGRRAERSRREERRGGRGGGSRRRGRG